MDSYAFIYSHQNFIHSQGVYTDNFYSLGLNKSKSFLQHINGTSSQLSNIFDLCY